jgi:hypothetical protein
MHFMQFSMDYAVLHKNKDRMQIYVKLANVKTVGNK